jgi:pyruvate-formate lyase-activating enzyme
MRAAEPGVSFVKPDTSDEEAQMLWREQVANVPKHWVRTVTACASRCLFCLDGDTPRNVYLSESEVKADLLLGREARGAWKVILSGGEASLHPLFPEFIRYAHSIGYGRVQTVTNGWRYADREFYERCVQAGLGEITFSLHGHTAELHNRLTRHKGAFERIVKAIRRAARDPRVICSIDVVINKQNVGVLDQIIKLGVSLGVTEFDLLHVIPQAWAYEHRDELFYSPREHLPMLRKVFGLNRHPRFVVWTNRFPVSFLEGMEDLIQDPHKMYDELQAIQYGTRRYLDTGEPLDCRQPERCVHCFNEALCTTVERTVVRQNEGTWEVWDVGADQAALDRLPVPLPYGIIRVGATIAAWSELPALLRRLPEGAGLYLRVVEAGPVPSGLPTGTVLVAARPEQADAWLGAALPDAVEEVELLLTAQTGPWIWTHQAALAALGERARVHQPSHEHMGTAKAQDLRDPARLFAKLKARLRVSGLPACAAPGVTLVPERAVLPASVFSPETGRLDLYPLAGHFVRSGYRAKSSRCEDCALTDRCDGLHINMIRDQGLRQCAPLTEGPWLDDARRQLADRPLLRISHGPPPQPPAPSLPGFTMPTSVPRDPLELIEEQRQARRAQLLAEAEAAFERGEG